MLDSALELHCERKPFRVSGNNWEVFSENLAYVVKKESAGIQFEPEV